MTEKDFCVIGLGKFGIAVVKELAALNKKIIAIDKDGAKVNSIATIVDSAITTDATESESLEAAGVQTYDNVVLGISKDVNASIITATILVEMGIPNIIAKADTERQEKVLRSLGIKNVVSPDVISGKAIAKKISYDIEFDFIPIDIRHFVGTVVVENINIVGIPLKNMQLVEKDNVNIVGINRKNKFIIPSGYETFELGDKVYFLASNKDANNFYSKMVEETISE